MRVPAPAATAARLSAAASAARSATAFLAALPFLFTALIPSQRPLQAAEGRAQVRLVRLLADVPDSDRAALGKLHDLRIRLEGGNVLILRKGGDFAALLPIERTGAERDSLRYFYYVQHPAFLWIIPGERSRGIASVADGGEIQFNAFRLRWRPGPGEFGWIYFPDDEANRNVRFSVVSGRTVDDADPMDTKYWVELGPPGPGGF